jgi:hypothetical protein
MFQKRLHGALQIYRAQVNQHMEMALPMPGRRSAGENHFRLFVLYGK